MKKKFIVGACFIGIVLLMSNSAMATTFTGTSSGTFENPAGPSGMVTTGVGTNSFTWGIGSPPSSLQFTGNAFSVDEEVMFQVGTLDYYNGTINAGSEADSVDLDVTLSFTTPSGMVEDFTYALNLINTVNTSDPVASADYVYLPSAYSNTIFSEGGIDYTLTLQFGTVGSGGFSTIDQFHVFENASASAQLVGIITTDVNPNPVPEPATMLLFGTGIAGLAGTRIRRKKSA